MPHYTPPLRDMRFVLHELFGATAQLKQLPKHAEIDEDTINAVLEEGGKFAAEVTAPLNLSGDATGCVLDRDTHEVKTPAGFKAAYAQFVAGGWPSLSCDVAYGGQGLPVVLAQGTALECGRYLVTTVMACGNCHTPKDAGGRAIAGKELAGGGVSFDIPPFAGTAANITPDRETGIGAWSDDEIKRAITHGERPNRGPLAGKPLAVMMAANFFKALLPSDLDAIVAYLRTLPPLDR